MKSFIATILIAMVVAVSANVHAAQRDEQNDFDYKNPKFYARIANCKKAVSLRYAPDVYSDCLVEVPLNAKITVENVAEIDGFLPVFYNNSKNCYQGYILSQYIKQIPWTECRNERDFDGAAYYAKIANCQIAVSLRYAPDVSTTCLIEIPLGTKVVVTDTHPNYLNGFLPVRYNGYQGYVLDEYIEQFPQKPGFTGGI